MLIFQNKGFLVPLYLIISFGVTAFLAGVLKRNVPLFSEFELQMEVVIGIALIIAGIWTYLARRDFTKNKYGEKLLIEMDNTFYYVSMKNWGYILVLGGLALIIYGLLKIWI